MMKIVKQSDGYGGLRVVIPVLIVVVGMTACGTVGSLKPSDVDSDALSLDFSKYDRITILGFVDATEEGGVPAFIGANFADRIAAKVQTTGIFSEVSREAGEGQGPSLTVSGDITRYAEGNPALKWIIGLGAGSTYFDAVVRFSDSDTKDLLGEMIVDKNSWVLGGGIAASQTVDQFMKGAAEKIADELAKAKNFPGGN